MISQLSNVNSDSTQCSVNYASKRPSALKRIPKNNSFDQKNSAINEAIQASLAATEDSDPDSPFFRRGRGMTEGIDEHQINLLNSNTQGMIKHQISMLNRQKSFKKLPGVN